MKQVAEENGVLAQIEERAEQLAETLSSFEHCIAVSSGKGGVGKSTIASLLALAFQSERAPTAVLDCDLNGPCQAHLMGLTPALPDSGPSGMIVPRGPLGVGVVSLGSWIRPGQSFEFESHAPEAGYVWRSAREFSLLSEILIGSDWAPFNTLILDLPPGPERTVNFARYLGNKLSFVLVTIPSSMASQVVSRSLAGLERADARVVGYIENMKGYYCLECRSVRPLFSGPSVLPETLPLLGSFPYYPPLSEACEQGVLDSMLSAPPGQAAYDIAQRLTDDGLPERNLT